MFGDKQFTGVGYPTPVLIPEETTCLIMQVPADAAWWALVAGLLYTLTMEWYWQQFEGGIERKEAAERWYQMLEEMFEVAATNQCSPNVPTPYWDDENGADADDEEGVLVQDWYGEVTYEGVGVPVWNGLALHDWLIVGFLAIVAGERRAIKFATSVRKFNLAFQAGDWGAVVKIFINGIFLTLLDTYRETPQVLTLPVSIPDSIAPLGMGAADADYEMLVIQADDSENNPAVVGQPTLKVIRGKLEDTGFMFQLRQNPDNSCQLQQSTDGGDTWVLAFDYSVCIPPALQTTMETVINNSTWVNAFAPNETFISQTGYDENQKNAAYQALCYAVGALVESMASACYKVKQGEVTAETLTAIALGIASTILLAFDVLTFGALTPVLLAVTGAALAAIASIEALSAEIWLDADNLAALKCLALGNLTNRPVSLAEFQMAFTDSDCMTSDQQSMADVFSAMLSNLATAENLYTSYLNAIGNANAAAQSGVLGETCVCDAATWCKVLTPDNWSNFTWGDHVEFPCGTVYGGDQSGRVAGSPGSQYWADKVGHSSFQLLMSIFIPSGSTLEALTMTYDTGSASNDNTGKRVTANSSVTCNTSGGFSPYGFGSGLGLTGAVNLSFGLINNGGYDDQKLTQITLSGTGTNPFGGCDDC